MPMDTRRDEEIYIRGIGVSPGLAVGKARFHEHYFIEPEVVQVGEGEADAEWARFNETAIQAATQTGQRDIAEYLISQGAPVDICAAAMLGETLK